MNYNGPAHSYEGHPNHRLHAELMSHLYKAEGLFEQIKHSPEDLGVAFHQLERIAGKLQGYPRRLPLHMQKVEQTL